MRGFKHTSVGFLAPHLALQIKGKKGSVPHLDFHNEKFCAKQIEYYKPTLNKLYFWKFKASKLPPFLPDQGMSRFVSSEQDLKELCAN